MIYSLDDLKRACPTFFHPDAMRFFNARSIGIHPAGAKSGYFVGSKRFRDEPRIYEVRRYWTDDEGVVHLDSPEDFDTRPAAHLAAAAKARADVRHLAG